MPPPEVRGGRKRQTHDERSPLADQGKSKPTLVEKSEVRPVATSVTPDCPDRIRHRGPLRDQHVHLAQLGDDLLGLVSLPRHGIRPPSAPTSHTSGGTTPSGQD